jgi:HD-GYP domain-containing protein (c-di-GMP phosphodiesterase class II)
MLRSKTIADYVEASLDQFRPGTEAPIDLHLYFERSRHVLIWRTQGELITESFLAKYQARGMTRVWIHRADEAIWARYRSEATPARIAPLEMRTPEGQTIRDLMTAEHLTERQRTAMVALTARSLLPIAAENHAREAVRDVLDVVLDTSSRQARSIANEIWNLGCSDPKLEHAVNVATYAVLFAMAFGRIDRELLADLGLAGLVHDIGLTQVPAPVVAMPRTLQLYVHRQPFARHVEEGLLLLSAISPDTPPRIRALIGQHHEKFDGGGYPRGLQGFAIDDIAQLLAMADTLDSVASGRWDGTRREILEALSQVEKLEKARNFPEHFNPELLAAVSRWMREHYGNPEDPRGRAAAAVIQAKALEMIKRPMAQAS